MCLCDLYDVDPKRREKLACLESVIRMRDAVREADAINSSTSATADGSVPPPCTETAVAGTHFIEEKAA